MFTLLDDASTVALRQRARLRQFSLPSQPLCVLRSPRTFSGWRGELDRAAVFPFQSITLQPQWVTIKQASAPVMFDLAPSPLSLKTGYLKRQFWSSFDAMSLERSLKVHQVVKSYIVTTWAQFKKHRSWKTFLSVPNGQRKQSEARLEKFSTLPEV